VRVVIAEDMVLLRQGLAQLLAGAGVEVVGQVGDGESLVSQVAAHRPDVALIDIKLPPSHTDEGLRAAIRIRREHPRTATLLLSSYLDVRYATDLLDTGAAACGYLLKERVAHLDVLQDALRRVSAGECVLDPAVVTQLLNRNRVRGPLDDLTPREREILDLMAQGHSNVRIGALLDLSPRTVESHVRNLFVHLGLEDSPDTSRRILAVLAYLRN